jgi:drug/metabolite transporter (DMT)-like permease
MYIVFKSKFESDNFQGLFHLYFGGLIAILLGRATNLIEPFDFNPTIWSPLIIFNLLVGFISISTLVYTINKMPSELFAALAFVGVLSGFIFSIIGKEAKPSVPTLIGSAFIVISAMAVRYLKLDSK